MRTQSENSKPLRIVFGIGGSIEAALMPYHITYLLAHYNFDLKTVVTENAEKFVSVLSLQGLTKNQVYSNNFQFSEKNIPLHLEFCETDYLIVFPCTARLIVQFSIGDITCPVTRLFAFYEKKNVIIAPSIHPRMSNEIYFNHLNNLKRLGCKIIGNESLTHFTDILEYFRNNFFNYSIIPNSSFLNK
jgi:phosphopantothenoylcysteine decarboxylase / phosphopantothenate---cysteine ligase